MKKINEEWRDIPGYPNYQVSNIGMVKSIERKVWNGRGYRIVRERILKPFKNTYGYPTIGLCKECERKYITVHRLVCNAFLQNPLNLPQINHINEIKTDNRVENLEFCDSKYNNNYGTRIERSSKANTNNPKRSKKVKCLETGKIYPSTMEIQRQFGFHHSNITRCCNNKQKSCYGYHWCYV